MVYEKKIVVIGGGTGTNTVLRGLKKYPLKLSAVVSMADDGGSTKILREEYGILPPGSVRPALIALADQEKTMAKLFNYRFSKGSLKNHSFGNLFLTALTEIYGDFQKAVEEAGQLLKIKGKVLPATFDNARLCALLENGQEIIGESNIDIPKHNGNLKIKQIYLKPECHANKRAEEAIVSADLIVIGPGDIYTSILPNFLVKGIVNAIKKSKAKKIYVCNLMTKFGETNGFKAQDFLRVIERYLGSRVDAVIFNTQKPSKRFLESYQKEGEFVAPPSLAWARRQKRKVIRENLLGSALYAKKNFTGKSKALIRHHPDKLARVILSLV